MCGSAATLLDVEPLDADKSTSLSLFSLLSPQGRPLVSCHFWKSIPFTFDATQTSCTLQLVVPLWISSPEDDTELRWYLFTCVLVLHSHIFNVPVKPIPSAAAAPELQCASGGCRSSSVSQRSNSSQGSQRAASALGWRCSANLGSAFSLSFSRLQYNIFILNTHVKLEKLDIIT